MIINVKHNNIKNILEEKNISIRQLSKDLDFSYSFAHNLVNRDSLEATQLGTIIKIAVYLDVSIEKLYR